MKRTRRALREIQEMNIPQNKKDNLFSEQFEHLITNLGYYNICEGSKWDLYVRFLCANSYQRIVMRVDWEEDKYTFTDFRYSFDDIDNDDDPIESNTYFFNTCSEMIKFAEGFKTEKYIEEHLSSVLHKDVLIDVAEEHVIRAFKGDICLYIQMAKSNDENHLLQIFVDSLSKEEPIFEIKLKTYNDLYSMLEHNKFFSMFKESAWIERDAPTYSTR